MSFYKPLDVGSYQVRLITFKEQPHGSRIDCQIEYCSLVDPPKYFALSYCWGDEHIRRDIIVNNVLTTVTTNLEEALQQLRADGIERVWADALCINQQDVQEKSNQIKLMGQIYSRAQATYSWLGGSNDEKIISALKYLRDAPPSGARSEEAVATQEESNEQSSLLPTPVPEPSPRTRQGWLDEMAIVSSCNYWKRRWIIQEIVVATKVVFFCGSERWTLDAVEALDDQVSWGYTLLLNSYSKFRHMHQIIQLRRSFQVSERAPLISTLFKTRHFLSKDDRDEIFAILGITSDGTDLVPMPSYHSNCATVVRDITREYIRKYAAFDVILLDKRSRIAPSDLPTWAPDWLSRSLSNPNPVFDVPRDLSQLALYGTRETLTVQGVILGKVVAMTSSFNGQGTSVGLATDPAAYYGDTAFHVMSAVLQCWRTLNLHPTARHVDSTKLLFLRSWFRRPRGMQDSIFKWVATNADFAMGDHNLKQWTSSVPMGYWRYRRDAASRDYETLDGRTMQITILLFLLALGSMTFVGVIQYFSKQPHLAWDFWKPVTTFVVPMLCVWLLMIGIAIPKLRSTVEDEVSGTAWPQWKLGLLDTGMMVTVHPDTVIEDKVCFIAGCHTAAVLRENGSRDGRTEHQVIGRSFACLSKQDNQRFRAFVGALEENEPTYIALIQQYRKEAWWEEFLLI